MAYYFDEQTIREIESRSDIVEVIAETVNLKRKGNRFWGLCPFHNEKTPSFSVSRDKQMFYCFGCHVGGNVFTFLMQKEGISFPEALELLADKAGVKLPQRGNQKNIDLRKQFIKLHQLAQQYFQGLLTSEKGKAHKYLLARGLAPTTIEKFRLGYADSNWNGLTQYLLSKGYSVELLLKSGLVKKSKKNGQLFDLFRERIIFPICQYNEDVIAFGGRAIGDAMPKYLNSPETEIFSKRRNLYGLAQARNAIREKNMAILVEGYIDCIKIHQAGFTNVVASLGTALTAEQAGLLHRYTEKVLLMYDGDEAGQRETLRALEILREEGIKTEVLVLPAGEDPDDFIEQRSKEEFYQYLENNRLTGIEFKLHYWLNQTKDLDLNSKIAIIEKLKNDVNYITSEVEKDYYIRLLSKKLQIEENSVRRDLNRISSLKDPDFNNRNKLGILRNNRYEKYSIQDRLMATILNNNKVFKKIEDSIGITVFANPEYQKLIAVYISVSQDNKGSIKLEDLRMAAMERGLEPILAKLLMIIEEGQQADDNLINEFICRVEKSIAKNRWINLFNEINLLEEKGDFNQVLNFILNLNTCLNIPREGGIL